MSVRGVAATSVFGFWMAATIHPATKLATVAPPTNASNTARNAITISEVQCRWDNANSSGEEQQTQPKCRSVNNVEHPSGTTCSVST